MLPMFPAGPTPNAKQFTCQWEGPIQRVICPSLLINPKLSKRQRLIIIAADRREAAHYS